MAAEGVGPPLRLHNRARSASGWRILPSWCPYFSGCRRVLTLTAVVGAAALLLLLLARPRSGTAPRIPIPVDITCPAFPGGEVYVSMCYLDRARYALVRAGTLCSAVGNRSLRDCGVTVCVCACVGGGGGGWALAGPVGVPHVSGPGEQPVRLQVRDDAEGTAVAAGRRPYSRGHRVGDGRAWRGEQGADRVASGDTPAPGEACGAGVSHDAMWLDARGQQCVALRHGTFAARNARAWLARSRLPTCAEFRLLPVFGSVLSNMVLTESRPPASLLQCPTLSEREK